MTTGPKEPGSADGGDVGDGPPQTGDVTVDDALRELAAAPDDDLDARLEAGEHVHRTLQGRLSDMRG